MTRLVSPDFQWLWHGCARDLPDSVRQFIIDIDMVKGGKIVASGTGGVSMVGLLHGMRRTDDGTGVWAVSMDAREHGGNVVWNILQELRTGALTPEQQIRHTLENVDTFPGAKDELSNIPLVNTVYFIISGRDGADGAVITRDRNGARDVWDMDRSQRDGFYRVETNYDHWQPVPKSDNRRDPANEGMMAMGPSGVSLPAIHDVLMTWPVFNSHTTITTMVHPATGIFNTTVWRDPSP